MPASAHVSEIPVKAREMSSMNLMAELDVFLHLMRI
jgi:hypothetical protein